MLVVTIGLGMVGFLDDYIKVFKKDKKGLSGGFKVFGQVGIGLIVGVTLYFNSNVVVKEKIQSAPQTMIGGQSAGITALPEYASKETKSMETTIPFIKNNEFDYSWLISFLGDGYKKWAWLIFIPIVILIVTAVSNGANITDGIDGLATGTSAIIGITLMLLRMYRVIMFLPITSI